MGHLSAQWINHSLKAEMLGLSIWLTTAIWGTAKLILGLV